MDEALAPPLPQVLQSTAPGGCHRRGCSGVRGSTRTSLAGGAPGYIYKTGPPAGTGHSGAILPRTNRSRDLP